jgi:N-acetylmuramoyl-L-alanine amidase
LIDSLSESLYNGLVDDISDHYFGKKGMVQMIKLLKFHVFFAAIFLILILLPSLTSCQSKTDSYTTSSLSATTNKKDPLTTSSQATGDGTDTVEVSTNPIESITPITTGSSLYLNKTICIDPGHGFKDNGAESTFTDANGKTVLEKNITLAICNYLVAELQNKGYTVVLTRGEDSQTPNAGFSDERLCNITQRINWANEQGYCLYVSIHCNSYTNSSTQGARIYYNSGNNGSINKVLCQDIANELSKLNGKSPSVFNDADLAVATKTIMPAALIETGFITNKSDFQKLTDSSYQKEFAASIASAIDQFMQDHPFDPNEVYPYL